MIPPVKKPITPRTGLVDALAPPPSTVPPPLSLQTTSIPVGGASSVSKENKKSQLKDRMLSTTPQQPIARQEAANSVHHRSESAPNLVSGKPEKFRSELGVATVRSDNGAVKSESTKHRQRPDPTCSAARTEIHHITKDPSKASFRQNDIFNSSNHSRVSDSIQSSNSRPDHVSDVKPRSESTTSKGNPVQVRSDLGMIKSESSHSSRPNKVDSIKPRHDPIATNSVVRVTESTKISRSDSISLSELKSSSVLRGPEVNKQSRSDNITPSEMKNRFDLIQSGPKVEPAQNKIEMVQSDVSSASSSKSGKSNKPTPALGPSLANSLASFVDSGLRWTDTSIVLDLSDDQQQSRPSSKAAEPVRSEPHPVKESIPKEKVEETEDQESLLQRDLAMVLEEISQITRLVECKDPPQQLPPQMTKASDSRTKSVIKTTGSLSTSHSSAATPTLTANPARVLTTNTSVLPPKLTSATRTPTPPVLLVPTSASRISSSPTGANTSINLISPPQTHSSRTISPVTSDHLKSGKQITNTTLHFSILVLMFFKLVPGHVKYNSSINKLLSSEFMTPPTAHSSSRHAGNFYASDLISPEKRKSEVSPTQQPMPPLPAHQQHANTNSVPRSSPNSVFRYLLSYL